MASINLEGFKLKSLHIETENDATPETDQKPGMGLSWATAEEESDPNRYALVFGIDARPGVEEDGQILPRVKLTIEGHFRFDDSIPPDKRRDILMVNGSSILYGIARGLLAGVSGAFGNSIILPTVDMVSLVADMVEQQKHVETQTTPKKKVLKAAVKAPAKRPAKKKS